MLVIGLTGGVGSGKTTVANLFAERGIPIIDADVIAREVTLPAEPGLKQIVEHFGQAILLQDGTLNRGKLREIIFTQANERQWLEKLLHPLIRQRIEQRLQAITAPYCIVVIPLLFEVKPYPFINRILVIDAPPHLQIERVTARDRLDPSQIECIMNAQTSRNKRLMGAQDVILNDGNIAGLEPQVQKLHEIYLKTTK